MTLLRLAAKVLPRSLRLPKLDFRQVTNPRSSRSL
jgi:hypothetical protein